MLGTDRNHFRLELLALGQLSSFFSSPQLIFPHKSYLKDKGLRILKEQISSQKPRNLTLQSGKEEATLRLEEAGGLVHMLCQGSGHATSGYCTLALLCPDSWQSCVTQSSSAEGFQPPRRSNNTARYLG